MAKLVEVDGGSCGGVEGQSLGDTARRSEEIGELDRIRPLPSVQQRVQLDVVGVVEFDQRAVELIGGTRVTSDTGQARVHSEQLVVEGEDVAVAGASCATSTC